MALQNAINKASEWLDLFNGGFRSRVQAGTLTANRTALLPDKSGTIAFLDDISTTSTAVNLQQTTNTACPVGVETVIPIAIQGTPATAYSIISNRLVIPYAGNVQITGQFYSETSNATTYTSVTSYVRLYSSTGTLKKTAQVTRPPLNGTWSTLDFSVVFAVAANDRIEFILNPLVNTGTVTCFAADTFFFISRNNA